MEPETNKIDVRSLISKMSLFMGSSGSGKTTLVLDIMYRLKDLIPSIVVFCPTNNENRVYNGTVPECCII